MIDLTSAFGRHADRRLRDEVVIWLTTVGDDFGPHPRPVWFLWDGKAFTIYSQPDTWKLRHLAARSHVSLHLNSDEAGNDVVVILGQAEILEDGIAADENEAYLEKYRERIAGLGMSPEEFSRDYSVVIRVTPSNLRGA
jgi:PPOX class probable F420-dependent enzyme